MANNKKTNNKYSLPVRNANEPFTIYLTEGHYYFSEQMLTEITDVQVQRKKDWKFPKLKFVSFAEGILKFENINQQQSFELTIGIEPDKLHVACSCAEEVESLCAHAYGALHRITWYGETSFFKDYIPAGLVEIATNHKTYFNIEEDPLGLRISPKPELGIIYQMPFNKRLPDINPLFDLPASAEPTVPIIKDMALAYIIMDSHRNKSFPFLLPCMGYLNKAGTELKGFQNFISGTKKEYDAFLTPDQKILNKMCHEMWQLSDKIKNGSLLGGDLENIEIVNELFKLWQNALPLLARQSQVFSYYMYGPWELKHKPSKQRLDKVEIRLETPRLQFRLEDREDILQLSGEIFINNSNQKFQFNTDNIFFLQQDDFLYQLSCLRDAALIEMLSYSNNTVTIFKDGCAG